jgi:GNAT superfamily N-acetyltransferase
MTIPELCLMGVDPDYAGKGVGTALFKAGLAVVSKRGLPIIIDASPEGEPLYRKHGWIKVDSFALFVKDGQVILESPVMIKEAARVQEDAADL